MDQTNISHTPRKHICSIIPPSLLLDILEGNNTSQETRAAVQKTYDHCGKLLAKRKSNSHQGHQGASNHNLTASGGQSHRPHGHSIIPSYVFSDIASSSSASPSEQEQAESNIQSTQRIHSLRTATDTNTNTGPAANTSNGAKEKAPNAEDGLIRKIYSSQKTAKLRKKLLYTEGGDVKDLETDTGAQEVLDYFGKTFEFYKEVLGRNGIDDKDLQMIGSLHYDDVPGPPGMDNAFWDGDEMAFGDGDGEIFGSFTKNIDVIGHELTHGVVQFTANLEYEIQSGALNESMADVFGTMIKQYFHPSGKQLASDADWLIGEGIFLPAITNAKALRSMKAPGTAYNNPKVGKDRQPATMDGYVKSANTDAGDWGGVHINSGIPNHAFYLASVAIGGYSWEKAGKVWYAALRDESLKGIDTGTAFKVFADLTVGYAKKLFDAEVEAAVKKAWVDVKVLTATKTPTAPKKPKEDL
ncbi:related to Protease PrtS [Rhynchosporium secalis]|uniref:Related to Protease PrtS n=1 Tax=Rhynchosporium secalis TaxID=38038 RepID=A0A1E1M361_RHYSE|nr:related to Protease PrtS [Rhynchosporium secalis]